MLNDGMDSSPKGQHPHYYYIRSKLSLRGFVKLYELVN